MAGKKGKSRVAAMFVPPLIVLGGVLALWENEGRFDYHQAAEQARVVRSGAGGAAADTAALTAELDTGIPVPGEYVEEFPGYLVVDRSAQIYSWHETRDDGRSTWKQGWYASLDSNSRNGGLRQTLSSRRLLPPRYLLGDIEIAPSKIHFVDDWVEVGLDGLDPTPGASTLALRDAGRWLYKGSGSPGAPQLGDERVSYEGIPVASIASYFGRIAGGQGVAKQFAIEQSVVSDIIGNDGILHHLVKGGREQALRKIESDFEALKWIVRGGGTLAIVIGIYAFFSAFVNLLYRIPLLGRLVSTGVLLLSLALGLVISVFVILSSLLVHNPLTIALPLALVVAGVVVFARRAKEARENVREKLEAKLAAREQESAEEAIRTGLEAKLSGLPASTADPDPSRRTLEDTFLNLAKLALAEGGLDKSEQRYLVRWGAKSGISKQRMKALFARAKEEGGELVATHRDDLELLACLAMADGVLSTRELKRLLGFGSKLGMSSLEIREIIMGVESRGPVTA